MCLSLMTIMTNVFAPLCIEFGATQYIQKTVFCFSGFANEKRIDSENNKKFLKAILCHQIYKEISGCPGDKDLSTDLRARLSAFTRGKKDSKHTLSPKELIILAANESTALFLSEFNRIEELIDVTACIKCVGKSKIDGTSTLETLKEQCSEDQISLYKDQIKKDIANRYNQKMRQYECADFLDLECTSSNITLVLTCAVLYAVFNNEACLEQLSMEEREKIKSNIKTFFDLHSNEKPQQNNISYYEMLWKNHHKGMVRDQVGTGNVRELIDFFVVPTITTTDGKMVQAPFSGLNYSKFVTAGSGFGKSTLLDIIVLCNIIDDLIVNRDSVISNNSKEKLDEYKKIRESLFGDSQMCMFPVFIHSDNANGTSCTSALELAEAAKVENFENMVDEAHKTGRLLFLIDSIDEVEADKLISFLNSIRIMLEEYPKASVIFASRFLGENASQFPFETLHMAALETEDIEKIVKSTLSNDVADALIKKIKNNEYLRSLVKNPFMLMTVIELKEDHQLHLLLANIVNAIIKRRWKKIKFSEGAKFLLGFLAAQFIFDGQEQAELSEIKQAFLKAESELKLYGVSYDVSEKNIEYFLKTLSSQSGILNVVNEGHIEKYVFQDSLVKCWLAANYIKEVFKGNEDVIGRSGGIGGIWSNANWLDKFIRTISQKEIPLSEEAVDTLVLTLLMNTEYNQRSILYYLIFKDATSLDEQEKKVIRKCYKNITENIFGVNDITNGNNSDALKLINNMLKE